MTPVEQALAASRQHMTVSEIAAATQRGVEYVRLALHTMETKMPDQLDCIPARGITPARYALKNVPAGALPADQPAESIITGCDGLGPRFPEAVAVAIENPGPDAGPPPSSAEGSGGDVEQGQEMVGQLNAEIHRLRVALACEQRTSQTMRNMLESDESVEFWNEPTGFLLIVPKRKPRVFKTQGMARSLALSAVRNGAKRAEVFALVPDGFAKTGAEWRDL